VVRHRGAVVDVKQRCVCDRDGEWYPFDRLEVAGNTLYYARPLDFDILRYHERWLIPDQGWSISRFQFTPLEPDPVDWYIEMELIDVEGPLWTVLDGYLDMMVWEGKRARSTASATPSTKTATPAPPCSNGTRRICPTDGLQICDPPLPRPAKPGYRPCPGPT
jgi:hypothetical protein